MKNRPKTVNSEACWRKCRNAEMLAKVQYDLFNVRYVTEIIIIIIIIIIYRLYLHNTNQLNLTNKARKV